MLNVPGVPGPTPWTSPSAVSGTFAASATVRPGQWASRPAFDRFQLASLLRRHFFLLALECREP